MISQIALLAASTAFLVSAQATAGCTAKSFVVPSWVVGDFSSTSGNISFSAFNRASNATSTVVCATASGSCKASGKLEASVQLSETSAFVSLNETWNCNDRAGGERFMFWAIGNGSVPLDHAEGKYTAKNPQVLIKGNLIAPVQITPIYFEGPTGHDAPGCSAGSKTPNWKISAVAYSDQTGDNINSIEQRSISFLVTNPATGYDASCMTSVTPDGAQPREDILTLTCAGLEFQSPTIGKYSTSTLATFNVLTSTVSINQTWYCDDTDPGRPLAITASGTAPLALACTTKPLDASNTKTDCSIPSALTLPGTVLSSVQVAPFSIEDPTPGVDGCTISSIFAPRWTFSAFTLEGKAAAGAATPTSGTVVGFNIILETQNRRYQYPMPISQGKVVGSGPWYECEIGSDGGNGLPLWPYKCQFKYDAAKKELVLDANWECRDLDVRHPVLFAGVATTTIKTDLVCESSQGVALCGTEDPSYTWTADIASVTWTAGEPRGDDSGLSGGLQGRRL